MDYRSIIGRIELLLRASDIGSQKQCRQVWCRIISTRELTSGQAIWLYKLFWLSAFCWCCPRPADAHTILFFFLIYIFYIFFQDISKEKEEDVALPLSVFLHPTFNVWLWCPDAVEGQQHITHSFHAKKRKLYRADRHGRRLHIIYIERERKLERKLYFIERRH